MKDKFRSLFNLVLRSLRIFLSDKAGVFFSLLAPLIVLILYLLFLKDIQLDSIRSMFVGVPVDEELLENIVNNWMLAGVVSVACVTVSFSAQELLVKDCETGVIADIKASPVARSVIDASHFVSNFAITLCICGVVLAVSLVYVAISGWTLSFGDVAGAVGLLAMSALSASLITGFIARFVKTSSQHGALVGIVSAAIGFLMGAYMPISVFPKAVQYVTLFVPGTYSAALYRELFMRGAIDELGELSTEAAQAIEDAYTLRLDFFGKEIGAGEIAAVFAATIVLFAAIIAATRIFDAYKRRKRG